MIEAILNFFYAEPTLTFVLIVLLVLVAGLALVWMANALLDIAADRGEQGAANDAAVFVEAARRQREALNDAYRNPRRVEINSDWRALTKPMKESPEILAQNVAGYRGYEAAARQAFACDDEPQASNWAHQPRGYGARGKPIHRT